MNYGIASRLLKLSRGLGMPLMMILCCGTTDQILFRSRRVHFSVKRKFAVSVRKKFR